MMTVVHIGYIFGEMNTGGAAIAATRLHKALLTHGVDSHYVCVRKLEAGENVYELPLGFKRKMFLFLTKATRCIWKVSPYRKSICMNIIPLFGLESLLSVLKPDVVHIHWLNADVASFEQIAKLPYKVVFNLHDLFVINAIDPHPYSDRRFILGFRYANSSWLERYLFNRKRNMVSRLNATFIGPSRWVCEQCKRSIIGQGCDVYEVSNLVAPVFVEKAQELVRLRNSNSKFTILFGALGGRQNGFKGFSDLVTALQRVPDDVKRQCVLQIYGEDADACETAGVKTLFLGMICSADQMVDVLSRVDVYAFPSCAETQGMTKIEALLCGLPVLAFDRTACAEGIKQGVSGWIAKEGDYETYSMGVLHYFHLWQVGAIAELHSKIATDARVLFKRASVLNRIESVYRGQ